MHKHTHVHMRKIMKLCDAWRARVDVTTFSLSVHNVAHALRRFAVVFVVFFCVLNNKVLRYIIAQ